MDLSYLITLAGIVSGSLGFLEYYFKLFTKLKKIRRLSEWESQLREQRKKLEDLGSKLENLKRIQENNQSNLDHLIKIHLGEFQIALETMPGSVSGAAITKLYLSLELENWSIMPINLGSIELEIKAGLHPGLTLIKDSFPPNPFSRKISIQSSISISREYNLSSNQLEVLHSYASDWIPFKISGYIEIEQLMNPKSFELKLEMHKSKIPKPR